MEEKMRVRECLNALLCRYINVLAAIIMLYLLHFIFHSNSRVAFTSYVTLFLCIHSNLASDVAFTVLIPYDGYILNLQSPIQFHIIAFLFQAIVFECMCKRKKSSTTKPAACRFLNTMENYVVFYTANKPGKIYNKMQIKYSMCTNTRAACK